MFSLAIVYTPEGCRPLRLARILDRTLLRTAASVALSEAEVQVEFLMAKDPVLGMVQAEEATKLQRVLKALMAPEPADALVV
jgi:hypothetical protein